VPRIEGLLVLVRRGESFVRAAQLPIDLKAGYPRRRTSLGGRGSAQLPALGLRFVLPAVHLADFDGDGLPDLFLTQEDRLAVFKQGPGGAFREQPDYARDFAIRTADELKESFSPAAITVRDLDGDGRADLVVRKQVSQGIASATTTSHVFFGQPGGGYGKAAEQVLRSEGASGAEVQLADVTGDGRPDLIVPSVNIGVFAIIRILTSKTVKLNFQVYAFDAKARRFDNKPSAERELRLKISTDGQADTQVIELLGDYDGDGKPDLAYGTDDDELSIFRGQPGGAIYDGIYEEDAAEQIKVRAFGEALPVDLLGQGRDDLVLHYPSTKGHRGELVVLLNQGGWPKR
jgi:FG-GAP-like repeat